MRAADGVGPAGPPNSSDANDDSDSGSDSGSDDDDTSDSGSDEVDYALLKKHQEEALRPRTRYDALKDRVMDILLLGGALVCAVLLYLVARDVVRRRLARARAPETET